MWKDLKFKVFIKLLHWYCSEEMDQWDLLQLDDGTERFFITFSRSPFEVPESAFRKVVPFNKTREQK